MYGKRRITNPALQREKSCSFCTNNINEIDYKNGEAFKRFLSSYAKILPRKKTGTCAKHQRQLAQAVKRARFMALIPYTTR